MARREFTAYMNVIPLRGYDIIQGVKWMQTVSPITFDFSAGQISINWQQQKVILLQDDVVPAVIVEPNIIKCFKYKNVEFYFLLQVSAIDNKPVESTINVEIQKLLDEFEDVFATPTELTPKR